MEWEEERRGRGDGRIGMRGVEEREKGRGEGRREEKREWERN